MGLFYKDINMPEKAYVYIQQAEKFSPITIEEAEIVKRYQYEQNLRNPDQKN